MPRPRSDITGQQFARLTAIRPLSVNSHGEWAWEFKCDCGKVITRNASEVKRGNIQSCGCYQRDKLALQHIANTKHGLSKHELYPIYSTMIARCYNPNSENYKNYGAKGIKVSDSWLESMHNWLTDMGPRPSISHSIDRIDNYGDYCKENCRWATPQEQRDNTKEHQMLRQRDQIWEENK